MVNNAKTVSRGVFIVLDRSILSTIKKSLTTELMCCPCQAQTEKKNQCQLCRARHLLSVDAFGKNYTVLYYRINRYTAISLWDVSVKPAYTTRLNDGRVSSGILSTVCREAIYKFLF